MTTVTQNCYKTLREKMDSGEPVTILYLGGSITEGAMTAPHKGINRDGKSYDYSAISNIEKYSWRARSFQWLKDNYQKKPGQFRMVNAAIGATDSELAAYRLEKHVLAYKPDLMFIEFAINDAGPASVQGSNPNADRSLHRTLSSIISRVRKQNPDIALFIPISTKRYFDQTNDWHMPSLEHYRKLVHEFRIPYKDIHKAYYEEPLPEGVTVDNVFDGPDEPGCNVHPSSLGHQAYAESVCAVLKQLLESYQFSFSGPASELLEPYPRKPLLIEASELPAANGWKRQVNLEYTTSNTHVVYGKQALYTKTAGATLTLDFKGSAVYLWGQAHFRGLGMTTGRIKVYIDDELKATFVDQAHMQPGEKPLTRLMPVINGLNPDIEHQLKIIAEPTGKNESVRVALHGIGIDQQ